jgi:hypothetical protein
MYVTITSLKLRSVWGFFKLSLFGIKISQQAKSEKGFVVMKNTGFGLLHYTLSQWQTEEDLKHFTRSGQHLEAMKVSAKLATEIKTYTFPGSHLPEWKTAKKLLADHGKTLQFK